MKQPLLSRIKKNPEITHHLKAFSQVTNIPLRLIDSKGDILWKSDFFREKKNLCKLIRSNGFTERSCQRAYKEAIRESLRWGEAIISKCCYFFMQIAVPVMEKGRLAANLVASPFLLVHPSELQPEELYSLHKSQPKKIETFEKALSSITVVKSDELRKAAYHIFKLADRVSDPDLGDLVKVREAQALQGKIADQICDLKNLDREFTPHSLSKLFYEREREIISKIRLGDRKEAKEILYQLLAIILIQYLENFDVLKISILELLIILSRAAVEAGAKIEEMLGMRYRSVTELSEIKDREGLCLWIVKIFEKIGDQIYHTRNPRNYQRLKKALDFIETHCDMPLTVERIAQEIYLSPSRLSHIFKNELGITLGEYISKAKIDKAKMLLTDEEEPISQVALAVGFPDQSYFTKVFKKVERCTPKVFRKARALGQTV